MEGRKRPIPDDNSEAANKEPAYGRRRIAHEASTSRRPESALSKTEHDNRRDQDHRPRAVGEDTRRRSESAHRRSNDDVRGRRSRQRSRTRESRGYDADDRDGRIRGQSLRGQRMQISLERTISQVSTSNRPKSRSPGQDLNPPTRRDSNQTASNQPVPQLSSPGRSSSMGPPPSVVSTPAENQPVGQPSPNETQNDQNFRISIRKSPCLYDRSAFGFKNKTMLKRSWTCVSKACGWSVAQCKHKLNQVKSKYRRLQRQFADKGSLSAPADTQFIEDWQFLPYQRKTTTQHTRPTVSSTANQTQSPSTPCSVVPSFDSGIRMNNLMSDQSFAHGLVAAMQPFSATQKAEFQSGCWKLAADIPRRPNA